MHLITLYGLVRYPKKHLRQKEIKASKVRDRKRERMRRRDQKRVFANLIEWGKKSEEATTYNAYTKIRLIPIYLSRMENIYEIELKAEKTAKKKLN